MFQKQAVAEVFDKLEVYNLTVKDPTTPKKLDGHATSSLAAKDKNIWNHLTSYIKGASKYNDLLFFWSFNAYSHPSV